MNNNVTVVWKKCKEQTSKRAVEGEYAKASNINCSSFKPIV